MRLLATLIVFGSFGPAQLALALCFDALGDAAAATPAEMPWRTDYDSAKKEAAKSGKRLLVVVGSPQCKWCVKQDQTTFRDADVIKLVADLDLVPVKVDGNADAALRAKLGVRAYPTTLVLDAKGAVLARHEGYAGPTQMLNLMRMKN